MQSFRQYKTVRAAVAAQVQNRNIINIPNEKRSVFEQDPSPSSGTSTEDLGTQAPYEPPIIVGWDSPTDSLNPRNWSLQRRGLAFAVLWINVFAVDWASSADSQTGQIIARQFHVSEEAEALSPSLYTFGLAIGSLFAGPLSETAGRNPVYVVSRVFHVLWLIGAALAPNFGAQLVFRFLAGIFGATILAIHAASVADLYGPCHRTLAWPVIALASFWGTAASPIVGAWIAQTAVDWRWTEWIAVLLSGSTLLLTILFLPETFSPILLSWRAKHLRDLTGCQRFQSELDLQHTMAERFKIALMRAFHMITRETIVLLLGGWIVLEYVVVFGFLQGFSFIFGDTYGFERGFIGTSFAALGIGCTLWTIAIPYYYHIYKRKIGRLHEQVTGKQDKDLMRRANIPGTDLPQPEYRLWSALFAAPAFPISLFWLGWSNYASISPWSDLGAVVLLGFSWAGIYVTVYQYLLDTYGIYAGSALAIVTCWRYLVSGMINLVSRPMYDGIGVHWSATWLGCLAALQAPLPIVFWYYGPKIRMKSAFAGKYSRPENPRDRIGRALEWR